MFATSAAAISAVSLLAAGAASDAWRAAASLPAAGRRGLGRPRARPRAKQNYIMCRPVFGAEGGPSNFAGPCARIKDFEVRRRGVTAHAIPHKALLSVTCPTRFRTEVGQAHASAGLRRSYSANLFRTVPFVRKTISLIHRTMDETAPFDETAPLTDNAACSLMVAAWPGAEFRRRPTQISFRYFEEIRPNFAKLSSRNGLWAAPSQV